MRRAHRFAPLILLGASVLATPGRAQEPTPQSIVYSLASPPSQFEWGCFAPCACPVLVRAPLAGSFILRESHADPLFTYYDVLDVRWSFTDATRQVAITGSGVYRRGGEVGQSEQLTLDLSFDRGPTQHFDSGLRSPGATFPMIDTRVSLHDEYCRDSVLEVGAKPVGVAGIPEGRAGAPGLSVAPNPATGVVAIALTLPRDATVDLAVYDIGGRRIRTLARRQPLAAGSHPRVWDGRTERGVETPPGLYVVQLSGAFGSVRRTVTRLR